MLNQPVPDFTALTTQGEAFKLSDHTGKNVVLYFYPKDSTPGCTLEAQNFRDLRDQFEASNTLVVGVSRDSVKSHQNFTTKQALNFPLLSDADEKLCALFDVIKMKKMYGKEVRGIERSTFVIDRQGVLKQAWRGVKVDGHAQAVLDYVKSL